jgi:hypothetical protein
LQQKKVRLLCCIFAMSAHPSSLSSAVKEEEGADGGGRAERQCYYQLQHEQAKMRREKRAIFVTSKQIQSLGTLTSHPSHFKLAEARFFY